MVPVSLPDPERELVALLTTALGAGIVSTDFPSTTLTGTNRKVQVDLEGGSAADYPVTERAQVRVTCHRAPGKRTDVKADAATVLRHLVSSRRANVAGIFPLGGRSAVSVDPDTGNVMCWVLVRVDLKATLAS